MVLPECLRKDREWTSPQKMLMTLKWEAHSQVLARDIQWQTLCCYRFWNEAQGHLVQPHESDIQTASSSSITPYLSEWHHHPSCCKAQNWGVTLDTPCPSLPLHFLSSTGSCPFFKDGLIAPPLLPKSHHPLAGWLQEDYNGQIHSHLVSAQQAEWNSKTHHPQIIFPHPTPTGFS